MRLSAEFRGVHWLVHTLTIKSVAVTLLLLALLSCVVAYAQQVIPETPAGKAFGAWLDAVNSGDRAKIENYKANVNPMESVDVLMEIGKDSGGFDLISIEDNERLSITFRVKERTTSRMGIGHVQVSDSEHPIVQAFELRPVPPGAVLENTKLEASDRNRVINAVIENLNEFYVYPEIAKKMANDLRDRQKKGEYDGITSGYALGGVLTKELQDVSHDRHLRVSYSPIRLPPEEQKPNAEQDAQFKKMMERTNCAFQKVEILPRNIGYLKFNAFLDPTFCGATVVAAMNFLAHVDAIIFDLRENGGGDPKMVAMVSSYLFDKPTHLNDLYNRKEDSTTQYWTLPYVPGAILADKPAFVLTSKATFSGAEEFTYNLKNLKRATIVGETTGGGAHPVMGHRIDDHFMVGVPFARALNPISKTNWEGIGVEPDVPTKSADALDKATELAASKLPVQQ